MAKTNHLKVTSSISASRTADGAKHAGSTYVPILPAGSSKDLASLLKGVEALYRVYEDAQKTGTMTITIAGADHTIDFSKKAVKPISSETSPAAKIASALTAGTKQEAQLAVGRELTRLFSKTGEGEAEAPEEEEFEETI